MTINQIPLEIDAPPRVIYVREQEARVASFRRC